MTAKKSALEEGISAVRVATQDAYDSVLSQTQRIDDFIATGREHSRGKSQILRFDFFLLPVRKFVTIVFPICQSPSIT